MTIREDHVAARSALSLQPSAYRQICAQTLSNSRSLHWICLVSGCARVAAHHPLAGRDAVLLGEATRRLEPLDRQGVALLGLAVVAVDLDRRVVLDGLAGLGERPRQLIKGLIEALRARVELGRRRRGRARSSVTAPDPRDWPSSAWAGRPRETDSQNELRPGMWASIRRSSAPRPLWRSCSSRTRMSRSP